MVSSSPSGLKDLLSPQPDSNTITKPMKPLTTPSVVEVALKLEEVSLGSNASLSTLNSSPSPSLQFSMSLPSNIDMPLKLEENLGGKKEELEIRKGNEGYLGKEKMEDNKNNKFTTRKCFPPPISCLKKVKVGKPFKYVAYDKESDSYVVEEIKIPVGSLFHASREDGRVKLFPNFPDEEESQEN